MRVTNKWGNKITVRDGIKFRSMKEAGYYDQLVNARNAGIVSFFLMQCPFHLPGNVKYVVDFIVFFADGTVKFIDVKGRKTKAYIRNKKMVEALYPVEIEER